MRGTGVIHAQAFDQLRDIAEKLGAPVTTSWGGRGALAETHPLAIPMPYVDLYSTLRNQADVVLVLGSRLGETDFWGKPPYWAPASDQRLIQVDIDDSTIGVNRPVEVAALADIRRFLRHLGDALDAGTPITKQPDTWTSAKEEERAKLDKRLEKTGKGVNPGFVPTIAQAVLPEDTIWVFDGGNTAVWSHFFHETKEPNSVITTFKLGMLGAGVSQALGAAIAAPNRTVCCLIGDGAMGFHPKNSKPRYATSFPSFTSSLWTWLGAWSRWGSSSPSSQSKRSSASRCPRTRRSMPTSPRSSSTILLARWAPTANGCQRPTIWVRAIQRAKESGLPAVIHVDVDPVTHMWAPALRTFKDMHQEPGG